MSPNFYVPEFQLELMQKSKGVETRQISSEINIDISDDGKIYGIELLNAKEQLIKEKKISFNFQSSPPQETTFFKKLMRQYLTVAIF